MHVGTTFAAINRAGLFDAVDAKIHLQSSYPAVPMTFRPLSFDAETHLADVHMFGQRAFGAVYLIDDERKAIVETGTSWDAERILEAVHAFGLRPQEIDAVVVSHIHLDHAGGAGFLVDSMSAAKVYVHERGYKHLVDPTRLVTSAREALGPTEAEIFGTMKPIPANPLPRPQELPPRQIRRAHLCTPVTSASRMPPSA